MRNEKLDIALQQYAHWKVGGRTKKELTRLLDGWLELYPMCSTKEVLRECHSLFLTTCRLNKANNLVQIFNERDYSDGAIIFLLFCKFIKESGYPDIGKHLKETDFIFEFHKGYGMIILERNDVIEEYLGRNEVVV